MADGLTEYTWVFAIAVVFSFIGAFGIGANDVANAFATSVGAKSITVRQAVIAATIFEFSGAFFMGSHVAKTIRKGICDLSLFQETLPDGTQPDAALLMFGMMCVCFSVAFWLLLATYLSLPVSTTHTCVGSVMGMAIAAKGWDAVNWAVVVKIIVSWFASPILSGLMAIALYMFIKSFIMKSENPQQRTLMFYPLMVAFCVIVVVFYTIYKGTPQLGLKKTPLGTACGVAFATGAVAAALTYFFALPWLNKRMQKVAVFDDEKNHDEIEMGGDETILKVLPDYEAREKIDTDELDEKMVKSEEENTTKALFTQVTSKLTSVIPKDIEKAFQDSASDKVLEMLSNTEKHDAKAELALSYLQVFSACFSAFGHGANDVANSIGPMAAVYGIWSSGVVEKKVEMPIWILAMGGVGIVIGLMLYGYNIMRVIGLEMTKISASRGFAIELGGALVVITGSRLGIPLSTTHCQVGATVGVGLIGGCGNVNWWLFAKVIAGWVWTLIIAAFMTAMVFSYAVYAPKVE